MNASFHNTTDLSGGELGASEAKAVKQEDIVIDFFRRYPDKEFTPWEVLESCPHMKHTPITSVRRAMTNLTKDGLLVKTQNKRVGTYGAKSYTWRLFVKKTGQLTMGF